MTTNTHGGKRQNSGRKRATVKKRTVTIRLPVEQFDDWQKRRKRLCMSMNQFIKYAVG